MTNSWNDIANTDVMLIIGANPAENHPCGFKWAIEARRLRNARMIVVDPRFTRTAATADFHVPIRAGSDLAFVGGLIRYVIENNLYAREYVLNYTNASFLVNEDFHCADEGLFFRIRCREVELRPDRLELPGEVRSGDAGPSAGRCCGRPYPAGPTLCISASAPAVFTLYAGDGRTNHRRSSG